MPGGAPHPLSHHGRPFLLERRHVGRPQICLAQQLAEAEAKRLSAEFYVIGHRGARGLLPENTLASFEKAIDLGVDVLETDLHMTADGEIVVYHDAALNPDITRDPDGNWLDGEGPLIRDLTLRELRAYDVGRLKPGTDYAKRFPDQIPVDGARIPTLREVIQLANAKSDSVKFHLEIKTSPVEPHLTPDPNKVVEAILLVLQEEGVLDRTYLNSGDWRSLLHAKEIEPGADLMMTTWYSSNRDNLEIGQPGASPWLGGFDFDDFGSNHGDAPHMIAAAGGTVWSVSKQFLLTDPNAARAVEEAHANGVAVFVWTVNEVREMSELIGLGVDGIITDRPDLLVSLSVAAVRDFDGQHWSSRWPLRLDIVGAAPFPQVIGA